jgi:hypothetical protein
VDKTSACWLWTLKPENDGYGRLRVAPGRRIRVHRLAWELTRGPIPDGMRVCHTCDTPLCVNPAHLWLGTDADNAADRSAKGRSATGERNASVLYPERLPRGDAHHNAKLTAAAVREMRCMHDAGEASQAALAERFGVSRTQVSLIVRRVAWRHV